MSIKLSSRSDIPVFRVLDILRAVNERVAAGEDIVHLEAGQPSVGAPQAALDAAAEILRSGNLGYTEATGIPALKLRIAQHYADRYGVQVDPKNVVITVGGSGGLMLSFLATLDAGDHVAMAAPAYPAYRNILTALGCKALEIPATLEENYQPTIARLEALPHKPQGLIIGNPSNPTGTMIGREDLAALTHWCQSHGVRLFADELYHGITYGEPADTVLRTSHEAISVNSFSKYFAMTGWRIGWLVLPEDVVDRVKRLCESLFVAPPTLAQHVALKCFDHLDVLDGYVARYKRNLEILKRELPKAGITRLSHVEGAFYLYADISDLTDDSEAFCRGLLDQAGVAATPGTDFDLKRGHQTLRISFAGSTEDIEKACARIHDFMRGWNRKSA
ncbi:MAG: aminotransferase class I/II-fold pyridoxal phosphate-dependent enzyme [Rhodospirillales bacterium]|nr:aminotransferase class I/II-fold pyridoxal phosphate-dependent enzyme [Alphaproteobacteria bacterium]MCB9986872.1 aminotransferase class I/II-fold pyridoxal phosphate-dependent enzyme [Rhodospirillales bacterium]USO08349.1 MAG: aminotransferase class I/II-fold pyridoxal phosphate-dependent enzyme [Rhodospirillales bacterium]